MEECVEKLSSIILWRQEAEAELISDCIVGNVVACPVP